MYSGPTRPPRRRIGSHLLGDEQGDLSRIGRTLRAMIHIDIRREVEQEDLRRLQQVLRRQVVPFGRLAFPYRLDADIPGIRAHHNKYFPLPLRVTTSTTTRTLLVVVVVTRWLLLFFLPLGFSRFRARRHSFDEVPERADAILGIHFPVENLKTGFTLPLLCANQQRELSTPVLHHPIGACAVPQVQSEPAGVQEVDVVVTE